MRTKASVTNVWFCMLLGQKLYLCCKSLIGLHGNVSNIFWEHLEQFGLNLLNIEHSKPSIKQYNQCFQKNHFFKNLKCLQFEKIIYNYYPQLYRII